MPRYSGPLCIFVVKWQGFSDLVVLATIFSYRIHLKLHVYVVGTTDSRKLHSLDPRPCEECGRVYSNLSNLRQHMKLIHFPTIVQCPICKKPFKTDLYLRRHFVNSHDTKDLTLTTNIISNNCLDNKYNLRSGQI